jgi:hypothetical protein
MVPKMINNSFVNNKNYCIGFFQTGQIVYQAIGDFAPQSARLRWFLSAPDGFGEGYFSSLEHQEISMVAA